jgi:hypothetical protein
MVWRRYDSLAKIYLRFVANMQHTCGPFGISFALLGVTLSVISLGLLTSSEAETPPLGNGWRLLRSANPSGGPDAISVDHTADVSRSDLDFAGLMLRCGTQSAEVAIVALTPFPPKAKPGVSVSANGEHSQFVAQVVPPGAQLLLPQEATTLAFGPWQRAHELAVTVTPPEQSFAGVVPIDGLSEALAALMANCAPR